MAMVCTTVNTQEASICGAGGLELGPHLSAHGTVPEDHLRGLARLHLHLHGPLPFAPQPICSVTVVMYDLSSAEKQGFLLFHDACCILYQCVGVWTFEKPQRVAGPHGASESKQAVWLCPWPDSGRASVSRCHYAFPWRHLRHAYLFTLIRYSFSIISYSQGSLHICGISLCDLKVNMVWSGEWPDVTHTTNREWRFPGLSTK